MKLRNQEDFENIFEYIDYLEMAFQYLFNELEQQPDDYANPTDLKTIVDKINQAWEEGEE